MICTLTHRLKPGAYDDFRAAWGGDDEERPEVPAKWNPVYMTRDVNDENVVVAFGFFNGSLDELRQAQQKYGHGRRRTGCPLSSTRCFSTAPTRSSRSNEHETPQTCLNGRAQARFPCRGAMGGVRSSPRAPLLRAKKSNLLPSPGRRSLQRFRL